MKDLLINIATGFFHTLDKVNNDPIAALAVTSIIAGFIYLIAIINKGRV